MNTNTSCWPDGEYICEAIGLCIRGNPLALSKSVCVPILMNATLYKKIPRTYNELKYILQTLNSIFSPGHLAEGIVFHHPDGRMAKIKRSDFDYGD